MLNLKLNNLLNQKFESIKGNKIDIYMNTHSEALAWGVKYLPVQVVK